MQGDLDPAIDRAVREMLDVAPPPDLRARVLERIQNSQTHPHALRWVIVPIAAAALLVLVFAGPWRASPNVPFIHTTSLAQSVAAIRAPLSRDVDRDAIAPPRTASTLEPRVAPAPRLASPDATTQVRVAPLEPLDAIDVPPVSVTRLDDREVAVAALAPIEQIRIEPVGPPEGRN
jgi:hypothetical protein